MTDYKTRRAGSDLLVLVQLFGQRVDAVSRNVQATHAAMSRVSDLIDVCWSLGRSVTASLRPRTSLSLATTLDALSNRLLTPGAIAPSGPVQRVTQLKLVGRKDNPRLLPDQLELRARIQLAIAGASVDLGISTRLACFFQPDGQPTQQTRVLIHRQTPVQLLDPAMNAPLAPETNLYGPLVSHWLDTCLSDGSAKLTTQLAGAIRGLVEPLYIVNPDGLLQPGSHPGRIVFACARVDEVFDVRAFVWAAYVTIPNADIDYADKQWEAAVTSANPYTGQPLGHEASLAWPASADTQIAIRTSVLGRRADRHARELVAHTGDPSLKYSGTVLVTNPQEHGVASYQFWITKALTYDWCEHWRVVIQGPLPWNWYIECAKWVQNSISLPFMAEATPAISGAQGNWHLVMRIVRGLFQGQEFDLGVLPSTGQPSARLCAEALFVWAREGDYAVERESHVPSRFYSPWREYAAH